jgi:hemin uptake protein HemP
MFSCPASRKDTLQLSRILSSHALLRPDENMAAPIF